MRDFSFYLQDDYERETHHLSASLRDEARAREFATMHLHRSPHCLSVEVWEAGKVLFSVLRKEPPIPEAA